MKPARYLVPQAVFVITGAAEERTGGMTASWVTRVSHRPAMFGVAIHQGSHTGEVVKAGKCFCLHMLGEVLAYLDCRVVQEIEVGDHTLFVGQMVDEGVFREGEPLRFCPSDYADIGQSGDEE